MILDAWRDIFRTVARMNPRLYTRDHYWVKAIKDDEVRVGLSDYGQDSTGDIITIDVEKMNEPVEQNGIISIFRFRL